MSSNEVFTRQNVTCSVVHGKYVKLGILLKSVKNVIFTNWNGCYWYSKPKCFAISHESIVDFFFFKVRNDWISASISCSIWNLSNWICIEVEFECLRLSFWCVCGAHVCCVWSSRRWCPLIINYNKNESSLINRWWSNILDRSLFLSTCVRVCVCMWRCSITESLVIFACQRVVRRPAHQQHGILMNCQQKPNKSTTVGHQVDVILAKFV